MQALFVLDRLSYAKPNKIKASHLYLSMRKHLDILSALLDERGLTQGEVAKRLGYKSASAVGMMLRGERGMSRDVLERMCELAGISLVSLAAQSDDLKVTKRAEALEAAKIIDELTEEQLAALMPLLRSYRKP